MLSPGNEMTAHPKTMQAFLLTSTLRSLQDCSWSSWPDLTSFVNCNLLSSRLGLHPPQREICQKTVTKNHSYQGTDFCKAIVYSHPIYGGCDVFILHLEKKLVCVVVERHIANPRDEYWNSLRNFGQCIIISA